MDITQALDQLAECYSQRDLLDAKKAEQFKAIMEQYNAEVRAVYTPELQAQVAEIDERRAEALEALDVECAGKSVAVAANIEALENDIKREVKTHGATVKGKFLQAVWSKPRVSWDTKALDGFAAAHPEITQFRTVGEPSVSIRANGKA